MHATTDPIEEVRPAALARLRDLATALTAHGFAASVEEKFWRADATKGVDKAGSARTVRVELAANPVGALEWYWVRSGIEDIEYLCPAAAIAGAVERIARELTRGGRSIGQPDEVRP